MRVFGKLLAFLAVVLLIVGTYITFFLPTDKIISQLNDQVQQTTGRQLSVDGEHSLSIFPSLSIELNQVRFTNMKTGSRLDMITMSQLVIHIPWSTLFTGDLSIDKFVINNPDILLEKDQQGNVNWQLLNGAQPSAQKQGSSQSSTTLPDAIDIKLGQVEINGGKLTFIDHQLNDKKTIDQFKLAIKLPSLRQTLTVTGSLRYLEKTFALSTTLSTPAKLINNQPISLGLDLASDLFTINYQGEITEQGKNLTGSLKLAADSLKNILAWQGQVLSAKASAFNQFAISSNITFANQQLSLENFSATLDAIAIKGKTTIALTEPLSINADFDLGELDLNPYLPEPVAPAKTKPEPAQPIVWDDTTLDLAALKSINANIIIRSSKLKAREITLGKNQLALRLQKGTAKLNLIEFDAYQGNGVGEVTLNANKTPYMLNTKFTLTKMKIEPLLTDATGFDKVMGEANLTWQLNTSGVSQRQFIENLQGELAFDIIDGAVKGANLAAIARSAENIFKGDLKSVSLDQDFSQAEKTDFASLTGKFIFAQGIGKNTDLALLNPLIRVTGAGEIDLPKTNIDYHLKTKLVASGQGQGGDSTASGISIPIKITGPFHKVKVRPDMSGGLKDKTKDKIKNKITDKLKGLFGR